ncbi:Bacterial alpha-L-rhamnosidase [candidate division KSB1 bacterium]|nr:Bacterial alpha-L-rhamnosidase [candidate division KSB1 bacterium]
MKSALFLLATCFLLAILAVNAIAADLKATRLRCEYKVDPMGIEIQNPRLSWELQSPLRNVLQQAFEIRAANSLSDVQSGKNLIWQTNVSSDQSNHVVYEGPALHSGDRVYWQVRVWDNHDNTSAWSQPAFWEMGLLQPSDWQAIWITPDWQEDVSKSNPAPMLRKEFVTTGEIESARAYVSALGLYEMWLNGQRVGDEVFTPGWTAYDDRVQYQTYDVTDLLKNGENAIGVYVGDGWYRGNLGFRDQRNVYGENLALLAQIEIKYKDGSTEILGSDATWKASTGPILKSDIYDGEFYDARLEKEGWTRSGYDDSEWKGVTKTSYPMHQLVAPEGLPVRKITEIKPVKIMQTPEGDTVFDMGQNMVGWLRLNVKGPKGTTVTLRHAEVLDNEGNFYTENLRAADQLLKYTLKGQGTETYEPHFTFMGFRYVAIEGYPGTPDLDTITGIVIHSDYEITGTFACSNELINQLQHNIQWGQRGNFLDVPTDCPQRDERLGWTGDAQAFAPTAAFNADVAAFYTKWLADLALDQKESGAIPHVIPNCLNRKDPNANAGSSGWADAGVIVPWSVYLAYGDKRILERQYESMKKWIEYMQTKAGDNYLWQEGHHYGDWLAFNTTRSDYPGATTDKDLIATAFFGYSTSLVQRIAEILEKPADAEYYKLLFNNITDAFQAEYMTPNGRLSSNTQTAYALALSFELIPESLRQTAADRLADDVRKFKHITTGFLGTPLIAHVLHEYGYTDVAFMLLNRKEYPSWLYPITKGATTIWERWDGIKPDGSFQNKGMNSFNHYAYGAIGEWLYSVVAGIDIDPQNPGYKHILIHPNPGGELSWAEASIHSIYGKISLKWEIIDGNLNVQVDVPANTRASVKLPHANTDQVRESDNPLSQATAISDIQQKGNDAVFKIGSGTYRFVYPITQ